MHIQNGKLILNPRDFPLDVEVRDEREKYPPKYSVVYTKNRKLKFEKPNTRTHNG